MQKNAWGNGWFWIASIFGVLSVVTGIINCCQVWIPWMQKGEKGQYTTVSEMFGEWTVPDDAWYVVGISVDWFGRQPMCAFFITVFAVMWLFGALDD